MQLRITMRCFGYVWKWKSCYRRCEISAVICSCFGIKNKSKLKSVPLERALRVLRQKATILSVLSYFIFNELMIWITEREHKQINECWHRLAIWKMHAVLKLNDVKGGANLNNKGEDRNWMECYVCCLASSINWMNVGNSTSEVWFAYWRTERYTALGACLILHREKVWCWSLGGMGRGSHVCPRILTPVLNAPFPALWLPWCNLRVIKLF